MKRKILFAIVLVISVIIFNRIVCELFVPDRPYGRDYIPIFHVLNSKWVSEDERVTLFVDSEGQIYGTVTNDGTTLEIELRSFHETLYAFQYIPDPEEYEVKGKKYECWSIERSNADRMIVQVYHIEDGVPIFEDGSTVTFYRVNDTQIE